MQAPGTARLSEPLSILRMYAECSSETPVILCQAIRSSPPQFVRRLLQTAVISLQHKEVTIHGYQRFCAGETFALIAQSL